MGMQQNHFKTAHHSAKYEEMPNYNNEKDEWFCCNETMQWQLNFFFDAFVVFMANEKSTNNAIKKGE